MTVHVSPSQFRRVCIRGNFSVIKSRWAKLFLKQRLQKVKRGALKWNGLASNFKSLQSFLILEFLLATVNKRVLQNPTNYIYNSTPAILILCKQTRN